MRPTPSIIFESIFRDYFWGADKAFLNFLRSFNETKKQIAETKDQEERLEILGRFVEEREARQDPPRAIDFAVRILRKEIKIPGIRITYEEPEYGKTPRLIKFPPPMPEELERKKKRIEERVKEAEKKGKMLGLGYPALLASAKYAKLLPDIMREIESKEKLRGVDVKRIREWKQMKDIPTQIIKNVPRNLAEVTSAIPAFPFLLYAHPEALLGMLEGWWQRHYEMLPEEEKAKMRDREAYMKDSIYPKILAAQKLGRTGKEFIKSITSARFWADYAAREPVFAALDLGISGVILRALKKLKKAPVKTKGKDIEESIKREYYDKIRKQMEEDLKRTAPVKEEKVPEPEAKVPEVIAKEEVEVPKVIRKEEPSEPEEGLQELLKSRQALEEHQEKLAKILEEIEKPKDIDVIKVSQEEIKEAEKAAKETGVPKVIAKAKEKEKVPEIVAPKEKKKRGRKKKETKKPATEQVTKKAEEAADDAKIMEMIREFFKEKE